MLRVNSRDVRGVHIGAKQAGRRRRAFDFADDPGAWDGPDLGSGPGPSLHFAFNVSDREFEAIFGRIKVRPLPYGSEPDSHTDGKINTRRGGRGLYFEDPNGYLLEIMTVPETGS